MTEQDVKTVTSATGRFQVLKPQPQAPVQTGNAEPEAGKNVPVPKVEKADLEELARALNIESQNIGRDLRFKVDMETGHSVIQVLDSETGEIIRQIPPEKAELSVSSSGAVQLRLYNERI